MTPDANQPFLLMVKEVFQAVEVRGKPKPRSRPVRKKETRRAFLEPTGG